MILPETGRAALIGIADPHTLLITYTRRKAEVVAGVLGPDAPQYLPFDVLMDMLQWSDERVRRALNEMDENYLTAYMIDIIRQERTLRYNPLEAFNGYTCPWCAAFKCPECPYALITGSPCDHGDSNYTYILESLEALPLEKRKAFFLSMYGLFSAFVRAIRRMQRKELI